MKRRDENSALRNGGPRGGGPVSPFELGNDDYYRQWREKKLSAFPRSVAELKVTLADLGQPSVAERQRIIDAIKRANMAIYVSQPPANDADGRKLRQDLTAFLAGFGLASVEKHRSAESDGFVAIEVSQTPVKRGFIPYTSKPLSWHTDGYYNPPQAAIRAMLLHCAHAATSGGENALLDPEIAYIRLRDANPKWVEALMRPDAMTIPVSIEEDGSERPVSTGPVFAVDASDGSLLMRYTARGRNIHWRDDEDTRAATAFLERVLKDEQEPLVLRAQLEPGEGLICNNVLHTRTAFEDTGTPRRLILRARFATRIATHEPE
ncbi:MAG: TauD/TfdA family dioxygenase [Hyphomicrobiaceae bacterium]